ncbi:AAA family ATPase [Fimbriiglobus ruber]|uniref:Cell division protein FtsH n=1 Tax=Fimbriiglobus ruber TaxID=1908690 RepID=A0A225E3A1_9BACT|nr:ATP-binding protein [Fimbriiglobus ruber]OWK44556.1 Cell division protein FtsH [Fimbriiglobus ruber]
MSNTIADFTADHRAIVDTAAKAAGFSDPVVFDLDEFQTPLLEHATRGAFVPVDGVFIRDWSPDWRKTRPGMMYGIRLYTVNGITFARSYCASAPELSCFGYDFFIVDRKDYVRLYRAALRYKRASDEEAEEPPVMPDGQRETVWRNTIGFLDPRNLKRIRALGGRAKRGLLLTGPPGNGKTSACRWIRREAEQRGWEVRIVGPDDYQAARRDCNPAAAVKALFQVTTRGVIFFDDMDVALRDRDAKADTDDQAVFLSSLDGIEVNEGVVYVFTTNCPIDRIDAAFRRPGRIDLTLQFPKPSAELRRTLSNRWHQDIRSALDLDAVVRDTADMSFAEIEELKNLLVLRFVDVNEWDWAWAKEQFRENRSGLASRRGDRPLGFVAAATNGVALNGSGH